MTQSTHVTETAHTVPTRSISASVELPNLTIGIDLGDRHSDLCGIDRSGEILEESRLPTTPHAFRQHFASMKPAGSPSRSAPTRRGSAPC